MVLATAVTTRKSPCGNTLGICRKIISLKFENAKPHALSIIQPFIKSKEKKGPTPLLILDPCIQILKDRRSVCTGGQTICKFIILKRIFKCGVGGERFCISLTSKDHTSVAKPEIIPRFRLHFPFYIHLPFLGFLLIIYIARTLCVVSFQFICKPSIVSCLTLILNILSRSSQTLMKSSVIRLLGIPHR